MSEWIVPVAGILVYLFFCRGCCMRIRLHGGKAAGRRGKEGKTGAALSENFFRPSVDVP